MAALVARAAAREAEAVAAVAKAEARKHRATLTLAPLLPSATPTTSPLDAAPTLCSSLRLAASDDRLERCLIPLHILAGHHLPVRLTTTREDALPLLRDARGRGRGVRVWPLGALRDPDLDALDKQERLQRRYGREHVVRPAELVVQSGGGGHNGGGSGGGGRSSPTGEGGMTSITSTAATGGAPAASRFFARAVQHAFGASLIVSNDALAATLTKEHGCPRCVTFGGNVHERGALHGGHRDPSHAAQTFAALLELQHAEAMHEEAVGALRRRAAQTTAYREAAEATAAAQELAQECERAAVHLRALNRRGRRNGSDKGGVEEEEDDEEDEEEAAMGAAAEHTAHAAAAEKEAAGRRTTSSSFAAAPAPGRPSTTRASERSRSVRLSGRRRRG